MSREQTERSVRRDRQAETRPVQLQSSRRFFTSRGDNTSVRTARALTEALGVGVGLYEDQLRTANDEGAARAANEAAQGQARSEDDENAGYNRTFDRIEAVNDLMVFSQELPGILENGAWLDKSEADVQEMIDTYFQGQLAGINPQSEYGQRVAEGILKQNQELLATHRKHKFEEARQEKRLMIYNAALEHAKVNDGDVDHETLMSDLETLVPGPGGRMTYLESVGDIAEEMAMPEIIDTIPERFPNGDPTGVNDPNLKPVFDTYRAKAQAARDARLKAAEEKYKADNQTRRAAQHSELTQRATSGDYSVLPEIIAGGEDGPNGEPRLLSRAQQKTLFDQLQDAQTEAAVDANLADLFGQGRAYGLTQNEYDRGASEYSKRTATMLAEENPDWTPEQVQAETLKLTLERSYRHDRLPKHITDFLDATPANPERFREAVNVKRMVDQYDDTLVQRSISDRNSAMMDAYEILLRDSGDPDEALAQLSQYDRSLLKGQGKLLGEIVDDVTSELADKGFWPGSYLVTTRDKQRAQELAEHYMALGFDEDRIKRFVIEAMSARNVRVGGQLYPVDSGWRKGDEALEAYLGASPGMEFFEEDGLEAVPHPHKKGFVVIRDPNAILPVSAPEVRISEIEDWYDESQNEQLASAATDNQADVSDLMKEAEERAYRRVFPVQVWGNSGERATIESMNRRRWDDMDPAQRERLIRAELR